MAGLITAVSAVLYSSISAETDVVDEILSLYWRKGMSKDTFRAAIEHAYTEGKADGIDIGSYDL
jgi:hypothetical protein